MSAAEKIACRELVEQVTHYLEGVLSPAESRRFREHLDACSGCGIYVQQMRRTVSALSHLRESEVAGSAREGLLELFRQHAGGAKKPERRVRLGIGNDQASPGDHIAYFWENEQEFQDGVGFLEVGLKNGDCCVVFGHEVANEKILSSLRNRGYPVEDLIQGRRLWVLGGDPSPDGMLGRIASVFETALAGGAPLIRLLGNIGWGRVRWPGEDDILRFEAQVTEAARKFPCVIVCMYDVRSLSGRVLLKGGFETHPLTLHGQVLQENPHHVPLELFLKGLSQEAGSGRTQ